MFGTARRLESMQLLAAAGVTTLTLDVTQPQSIRAAVDQVLKQAGRIDVLVVCMYTGRIPQSRV